MRIAYSHHIPNTFWSILAVAGFIGSVGCSAQLENLTQSTNTHTNNTKQHASTSSILLTQDQSALYRQMLEQGNYSDAAIFQSFQQIQSFHSDPTNLFVNMPTASNLQPPKKENRHLAKPEFSAPHLSAAWHTKVGWSLVLDGNYPGAEAAYRQALRQNAKSAKAYLGLGMALMLQGNRQEAISAYQRALKIQPKYPAALVHLGYTYTTEGKGDRNLDKAKALFKQASALGDPFALLALLDLKGRNQPA